MKQIVLIIGYPASGKTTLVNSFTNKGYKRFNRDLSGGSIDDLHSSIENYIKKSDLLNNLIVIDNTYPTVESRKGIIDIAKKYNFSIVCWHLNATAEDAQFNSCFRMVKKYGKLLSPEEIKLVKDPNVYPPAPIFKYKKEFQEPTLREGFEQIKIIDFKRNPWPSEYKNKALILDFDGTLRETISGNKFPTSPSDIRILPNRKEKLKEYKNKGYILLGVSNQSGITKKQLTEQQANDCFRKTCELLGVNIDVKFCSHSIPPIVCYCRKPLPGIGVEFIEKYKLNPSECIMVGDLTSDKAFAQRSGFSFISQDLFFK